MHWHLNPNEEILWESILDYHPARITQATGFRSLQEDCSVCSLRQHTVTPTQLTLQHIQYNTLFVATCYRVFIKNTFAYLPATTCTMLANVPTFLFTKKLDLWPSYDSQRNFPSYSSSNKTADLFHHFLLFLRAKSIRIQDTLPASF